MEMSGLFLREFRSSQFADNVIRFRVRVRVRKFDNHHYWVLARK